VLQPDRMERSITINMIILFMHKFYVI